MFAVTAKSSFSTEASRFSLSEGFVFANLGLILFDLIAAAGANLGLCNVALFWKLRVGLSWVLEGCCTLGFQAVGTIGFGLYTSRLCACAGLVLK